MCTFQYLVLVRVVDVFAVRFFFFPFISNVPPESQLTNILETLNCEVVHIRIKGSASQVTVARIPNDEHLTNPRK